MNKDKVKREINFNELHLREKTIILSSDKDSL